MGSSARSAGEALGRRKASEPADKRLNATSLPTRNAIGAERWQGTPAPMADSPGQAEAVAKTLRNPPQIGIQAVGALYTNFC